MTLAVSLYGAAGLVAQTTPGQSPAEVERLRRLAEQGDVDAQFALGMRYATR